MFRDAVPRIERQHVVRIDAAGGTVGILWRQGGFWDRLLRGAILGPHDRIEVAALVQCEHGAREYCADTASRLPVTKHPVDARVVNFGKTLCILFDRQLLPLTPRVKHSQDVIENPMQWQFW